jgi:hypothetical protein
MRTRLWRMLLVRVEHVHINEGGKALIGNVAKLP